MRLALLLALLCFGAAPGALAAGGGGGAGGSGAQNNPATGLPPGEPGPRGAANNPRPRVVTSGKGAPDERPTSAPRR